MSYDFEMHRRLSALEDKFTSMERMMEALTSSHQVTINACTTMQENLQAQAIGNQAAVDAIIEAIFAVATAARSADQDLAVAVDKLVAQNEVYTSFARLTHERFADMESVMNDRGESISRLRGQIIQMGVAGALLSGHVIAQDEPAVDDAAEIGSFTMADIETHPALKQVFGAAMESFYNPAEPDTPSSSAYPPFYSEGEV